MAINTTEDVNLERYKYTVRPSYLYQAKHFNDNFANLGYKYDRNILRNTTSAELRANPMQNALYSWIEAMILIWFEETKMIKKTFSIAHDKNTRNIN
jgi:hypothetical protein